MTREAFISLLEEKGCSYKIEEDKIVVSKGKTTLYPDLSNRDVYLGLIESIPSGVEFNNSGDVYLGLLKSIPPGVEFNNGGHLKLELVTSLSPDVGFNNGGNIRLYALESIPPGVEFKNGGEISLHSLKSIPPGVVFNNGKNIDLDLLIGEWIREWKGNIDGIDSKGLFNGMIKRGIFVR